MQEMTIKPVINREVISMYLSSKIDEGYDAFSKSVHFVRLIFYWRMTFTDGLYFFIFLWLSQLFESNGLLSRL